MREDIISQKLQRELSNLPIDTEPRAMYLMVEIRKILEHEGGKGDILRFYCNWVAHAKMDRSQAQKVFEILHSESVEVSQIIAFNRLKAERREFFEQRDLATDLTDRSEFWEPFKERLIDILVDTPIERVEQVVTGAFLYQRRGASGIEFCLRDSSGIRALGRIIE